MRLATREIRIRRIGVPARIGQRRQHMVALQVDPRIERSEVARSCRFEITRFARDVAGQRQQLRGWRCLLRKCAFTDFTRNAVAIALSDELRRAQAHARLEPVRAAQRAQRFGRRAKPPLAAQDFRQQHRRVFAPRHGLHDGAQHRFGIGRSVLPPKLAGNGQLGVGFHRGHGRHWRDRQTLPL
jgi:hypothetical protein